MTAKPKQHVVVVDGSNLATEGRTVPSLKQLDEAVRAYAEEDPTAEIVVVVDASFEHRIDPSERAKLVEAELHGEVVSPPAGAIGRGDAFVLRIAERTGARVLSNDSFQEFHAEHPWLFDEGRLVGGKPVPGIGWIFTPRLPVRGPKSRQVTGKARRAADALSPPVKAAELAKAAKKAAARKVPPLPPGVTPKVGDVWTALAEGNGHQPPASGGQAAAKAAAKKAPGTKRAAAKKAPAAKKAVAAKEAAAKEEGAETAAETAAADQEAAPQDAAADSMTKAAEAKAVAKAAGKRGGRRAGGRRTEAVNTAGGASEAAAGVPPELVGPGVAAADVAGDKHVPEEPVAKKAGAKKAAKKATATKAAAAKAAGTKAEAAPEPAKKGAAKKAGAKKARAKVAAARAEPPAPSAKAKSAGKKVAAKKAAAATSAGKKSTAKKAAAEQSVPQAQASGEPSGRAAARAGSNGARSRAGRRAREDPAVQVAIDQAMAEVLSPPPPREDAKKGATKKAKEQAAKDGAKNKRRRRRSAAPPPAVNEPLAFITFVATYPLQSEVEGEVVSFTSHGAMVDVGLPGAGILHCYIPLTGMGDPPPAKARQVLSRGQRRRFVLVGLDPPRRVAELALPGVAAVAASASASGSRGS